MYEKYGDEKIFGRNDVEGLTGLKSSRASDRDFSCMAADKSYFDCGRCNEVWSCRRAVKSVELE